MTRVRPSAARGHVDLGWLDSRHSFSFGSYHDPAHMGFSDLRVINQDVVQPGAGFPTHAHADMEIITYVLRGALAHRDSLGTVETINAGELQRMTAGTGIEHSEFNASSSMPVEFLQIWVQPDQRGLTPSYQQIALPRAPGWTLVAGAGDAPDRLKVHQDMQLHRGLFEVRQVVPVALAPGRRGWLQLISGTLDIAGLRIHPGDGVAFEASSRAIAASACEMLMFDLRG